MGDAKGYLKDWKVFDRTDLVKGEEKVTLMHLLRFP